jgi:hypothetical protein
VYKRAKKKWNKTWGIAIYVVAMIAVITLTALYQRASQTPKPKKPASEYFQFSGGFAVAESQDPENYTILIKSVSFNITAVGGNATRVLIIPHEGSVAPEDIENNPIPKINQGETVRFGPIDYVSKVPSEKENGGWPVHFTIDCDEAYGYVTVYIEKFVEI